MIAKSKILDEHGRPHERQIDMRSELGEMLDRARSRGKRQVSATYDAARDSIEHRNYWANSDRYDADSASSPSVRETLRQRSRYDTYNNGYSDGIAQTYATDVVGVGPTLRMETPWPKFNRMVELQWYLWARRVNLRRKLWCMAHAKHVDGEAFAVARHNPRLRHPVKVDLVLYEAEQCQTPFMPIAEKGYIDGIRFDEFGNPLWYDILREHPGATNGMLLDLVPERVDAKFVLHWFKLRRPGQHRGIPECTSTLNIGAAARRWREAQIAAAELAADLSLFIQTAFQPDNIAKVAPMSMMDVQKGTVTALPEGYGAFQMKAEHPHANSESFQQSLINEQARPKSMPRNKAMCDSSAYNYASGRLDHQTYYATIDDVDREDANDTALDVLFDVWFEEAVAAFGWFGGKPRELNDVPRMHGWNWPSHRVVDAVAEARANDIRLKHGGTTLTALFASAGLDFEDELLTMTQDCYGDTSPESIAEMRTLIRNAIYNAQSQQASMATATKEGDE